jgi:glycosyltransferase involved in cell wall biosynthesis
MDNPLTDTRCVDVIIPVYNGSYTIKSALGSVLSQQGNWVCRIIVVNDGSTDDTAEIVQNLSSPNIELISTPNQGVARARNLGIDKSTAKWVAFLDADDTWMPGKLTAQLIAAQENNVEFLCGSAGAQTIMKSGVFSIQQLALGNFVATSSVLVKRTLLQHIQPTFNPGMLFAEDYLAWLKCVTLSRSYFMSTKLVEYTLSGRPRYRWAQILYNLVVINVNYSSFLRQIGAQPALRVSLAVGLMLGSVRSLASIVKRFISFY